MLSVTAQKIMKLRKLLTIQKKFALRKLGFFFVFFFHADITLYNLHKRWPQSVNMEIKSTRWGIYS